MVPYTVKGSFTRSGIVIKLGEPVQSNSSALAAHWALYKSYKVIVTDGSKMHRWNVFVASGNEWRERFRSETDERRYVDVNNTSISNNDR